MKLIVTFLVVLHTTQSTLLDSRNVTQQWATFKHSQGRRFPNQKEEIFRRSIFQKNLQLIEEHNRRYNEGLESYTLNVNQFTDLTAEELLPYTHGLGSSPEVEAPLISIYANSSKVARAALPETFDWRSSGIITGIKNQMNCGSCWAFSTIGALEAHHKIHHGSAAILSEQQLIDCVPNASGCKGGWMTNAFTYISQNGGINHEAYYPYRGDDGYCRYKSSKPRVQIKGYAALKNPDEEMLKEMVFTQGPVSAAIDASGDFARYGSGVYYNPNCSTQSFTHAIVVVGYGRENGLDYWLVKNSWGSYWGLNGYIKMVRNQNNHCGIASKVSYPVF